jgi:hypothetical protein
MKRKPEPAAMAEIHKIQVKIHEETKGMSIKEELAYYRRARKELGLEGLSIRRKRKTA